MPIRHQRGLPNTPEKTNIVDSALGTPIENLTVNISTATAITTTRIALPDYILASNFGLSVGDPGYDTNADLNGDTEVSLGDYIILAGSFG